MMTGEGRLLCLFALALAGCGSGAESPPDVAANISEIERLSTPREEKSDPRASVRLQTISEDDLPQEGVAGPSCRFTRGDQLLLTTFGGDALVRQNGERRHLVHSAPVGATGGFFEDRHLSVSVGRDRAEPGEAAHGSWPARITITNRRNEAQLELRGVWTCRA